LVEHLNEHRELRAVTDPLRELNRHNVSVYSVIDISEGLPLWYEL
jgi:hypothetical protein